MSKVRNVPQDHFEEAYALAIYAFNVPDTTERKANFRTVFNHSNTFGIYQQNELKSQMLVLPLEVLFHGETMSMGGISYVSSYPETRGMGNIKKLFTASLDHMNREGMVLSYLDPFSYPFYRKFGYEVAFNTASYTIDTSYMPKTKKYPGQVSRVKWEQEKETITNIYLEKYKDSVGPLKRTEWLWQQKFSDPVKQKLTIYKDNNDEAKGYLSYHFGDKTSTDFIIDEMVYLTADAYTALWQFVASHQSTFKTVQYKTAENEYIMELFPRQTIKKEVDPFMMARIVNIESFLMRYPFKEKAQTTFYLQVKDRLADWNNGIWKVELRNTGRKVTKLAMETEIKEAAFLSASIQTWTQLFLGYRSIEELKFHEKLICSTACAAELAERIPQGDPQLYDYF